jgi:hypothetical protein
MQNTEKSPKSYSIAVTLCGIFGILGVHHFYLGNFVHGFVDLGLVILALWMFATGKDGLATVFIIIDLVHTVFVFYRLITEKERDAFGRLVTYG